MDRATPSHRLTRPALAALALALVIAALVPVATAQSGDTVTIRVVKADGGQWAFEPADLRITPGTTVTWLYDYPTDTFHTVTSTTSLERKTPSGLFDERLNGRGESFSFMFNDQGTFHYYCQPHSAFMTGTIAVAPESSGIPGPAPLATIAVVAMAAFLVRRP